MIRRTAIPILLGLVALGLSGISGYECTRRENVSAPPPEELEAQQREEARQELEAEIGEAARDERFGEER